MRAPLVTNDIKFRRFTVSAPGTGQQFTDTAIPDGFKTVFKARLSNTGNVYIAESKDAVESSVGDRKTLEPGESITVEIDNLNRLWRDADNSTDVIEVTDSSPS